LPAKPKGHRYGSSAWFKGTLRPRILDGLSGAALLAAAGTVASTTLRNR
jgi:hypothetical protein